MDHLPCGAHPLNFKALYICTNPYVNDGPWISYPKTQDINLMHLRFQMFRYYDREKMGSFFQNWLFFGLLEEILKVKVDASDFIREDETGQKFISTAKLPEYVQTWQQKMTELSSHDKLEIYRRNSSTMSEAVIYTRWLTKYPNVALNQSPEPLMSRETALSLAFLGVALQNASREALNPEDDSVPMVWGFGHLLVEHIQVQGWCPFLVAGLEHTFTLESQYCAAQIGPPKVQRGHRKCSDDACVTKPLRLQHLKDDCNCCILTPDIESVVKIIRKDITPLLRFHPSQRDEGKGSFLEVLRDKSTRPYVALSHVWKDGLGNEKSNSLSQCQLARIQKAVNSLFGNAMCRSYPFWMDTLLVPQGYDVEKQKTLNRMTKIYKDADKVLVIDSEIVASCSRASSPTDILIRICLSNWVRRLWTLQEGVFANSIHFMVSDGTISFVSLFKGKLPSRLGDNLTPIFGRCFGRPFDPIKDENQDPRPTEGRVIDMSQVSFASLFKRKLPSFLGHDLKPIFGRCLGRQFYCIKQHTRPTEGQVINMLQQVGKRTSTFNTDEALCIALLLDIDPTEILEVRKTRNPMPVLIKAFNHSIPPCMFLSPGKRNEEDGFRWAPQSFLIEETRDFRSMRSHPFDVPAEWPSRELIRRPSGVLDDQGRGLTVMFPGILLGKQQTDDPLSSLQFLVDTSLETSGPEVIEEGKPPLVWRITYSRDKADKPWKYISPRKETSESMAIIICSYGPQWRETANGILVHFKEKVDREKIAGGEAILLVVRRICRVLITGTPEYDNFSWQKAPEKRITGTWRPVTQMWCVD
jgi:hypothetical protein